MTANYPTHEGYKCVDSYTIPEHLRNLINDSTIREFAPEVVLGKTASEVLVLLPRFLMIANPKVVYYDNDGLVVEWHYDNVILTFAYAKQTYESAYCVQQIQVKDVNNR